jgi:hypothetical protein
MSLTVNFADSHNDVSISSVLTQGHHKCVVFELELINLVPQETEILRVNLSATDVLSVKGIRKSCNLKRH